MIDNLDRKIIEELQINGRETYIDLAKKLGMVEGTIRKRIKNLLDDDMIKIVAVPNIRKLGYSLVSIMGLQVRMEDLRSVAYGLMNNEHVCYLAFVAGRFDLIAVILTQSPEELSLFVEKEISAIPSISRTETFINLEIIKGEPGLLDTIQAVKSLPLDD